MFVLPVIYHLVGTFSVSFPFATRCEKVYMNSTKRAVPPKERLADPESKRAPALIIQLSCQSCPSDSRVQTVAKLYKMCRVPFNFQIKSIPARSTHRPAAALKGARK